MKLNSYNNNHHVFFYKDTRILFSYGIPVAAIFYQGTPHEGAQKLESISTTTSRIVNKFLENVVHVRVVEDFNHVIL